MPITNIKSSVNASEIDNAKSYPEIHDICKTTRNRVKDLSSSSFNSMDRHPVVRVVHTNVKK